MTQGSLPLGLLRLAWPSCLQAILANLYAVADFYFVGHQSDTRLASAGTTAIAASVGLQICLFGLHNVVPAGCAAYSAQQKGAKDRRALALTFQAAFWSCLALSSSVAMLGLASIGKIASITNSTAEVTAEVTKFVGIILLASPAFGLLLLVDGFFKSNGNTLFPLRLEICSLCINLLLNYAFVWRLSYGIAGSAVASALSRLLPALVGLHCILRGDLGFEVRLFSRGGSGTTEEGEVEEEVGGDNSDKQTLLQRALAMMRLGAFQSASDWLYGGVFTVLIRLAGTLGPAQQAGLGCGMRGLEWISFCVSEGFLVASLTSVGNLIGAGMQRRANLAALIAACMSSVCGCLTGLPFIFLSKQIASILSNDPDIVHYCGIYIHLMGMVSFTTGFEIAAYGSFLGAGKARGVFLTNGSMNILRIPLCCLCLYGRRHFFGGMAFAIGLGSPESLPLLGTFNCICFTIMGTAATKALLFAIWLNTRFFSQTYFKDSSLLTKKASFEIQLGPTKTASSSEYSSVPLGSDSEHGGGQMLVTSDAAADV